DALRAIESAHQPGEKGRTSVSLAHTPPRPEEQKSEHQHGAADPVPDERKQPDRVGGKPGYVRSEVLRPLRSVTEGAQCDTDRSQQEHQRRHLAFHRAAVDRKSTRLNSSHQIISYAVFCLKKKKQPHKNRYKQEQLT